MVFLINEIEKSIYKTKRKLFDRLKTFFYQYWFEIRTLQNKVYILDFNPKQLLRIF